MDCLPYRLEPPHDSPGGFLGGDPGCYHSLHGIESINELVQKWQTVCGIEIDASAQHVSKDLEHDNPWRRLKPEHLTPEALEALNRFYAADWAFLALAQAGMSSAESDLKAA